METTINNVEHNREDNKFYAVIDNYEAYLEYRFRGTAMIEYYFIFTPVPIRGRNVASDITKAALEFAEKENLTVIPSCSFVDKFMQKHKKYQPIRSQNYDNIVRAHRL